MSSPQQTKNKYGIFTDRNRDDRDHNDKKRETISHKNYELSPRHLNHDRYNDHRDHRYSSLSLGKNSPPLLMPSSSSHRKDYEHHEFDRERIRKDDLRLDLKSKPNLSPRHSLRNSRDKNYDDDNHDDHYHRRHSDRDSKLRRSHSSSLSASVTSLSSASLRSNSLDKLSARRRERYETEEPPMRLRPTTASTMMKRSSFGPSSNRLVDKTNTEKRRLNFSVDEEDLSEKKLDRYNERQHTTPKYRLHDDEPIDIKGGYSLSRHGIRSPREGYMKKIEEDPYSYDSRKSKNTIKIMEPTTTMSSTTTGYNQPRYKPTSSFGEKLRLDL